MIVKMQNRRLKVIGGTLLIFVMGVLAGSLATGYYMKHRFARFVRGADPLPIRVLKRISHRLDLSGEQQTEIDRILTDARKKWIDFRIRVFPEARKSFEEDLTKIRKVLTPGQNAKLDRIYERINRRAHFGGGPWPMAEGPPPAERMALLLSELATRLNMEEKEFAKVRAILEEGFEEKRKIFEKFRKEDGPKPFGKEGLGKKDGMNPHSLKSRMREDDRALTARLEKVLDEKQMAVYRELMPTRGPFRRGRGPGLDFEGEQGSGSAPAPRPAE